MEGGIGDEGAAPVHEGPLEGDRSVSPQVIRLNLGGEVIEHLVVEGLRRGAAEHGAFPG